MIPPEILEDIKRVVDYLYEAEAEDYEELYFEETNLDVSVLEAAALSDPEGNHIFCTVVKLKKFLEGNVTETYDIVKERIVIVVEGGVVQNIMTDNPESEVVCFLVDYDNLKEGQTEPPGEWEPELNPAEVELCATGEHPDIKKYLEANNHD